MTENHAITIRVDSKKSNLLNILSEEYKRSKNFLINEALESYLEQEELHLNQIQESITQANSGKVIEHDEVKQEINTFIASMDGG